MFGLQTLLRHSKAKKRSIHEHANLLVNLLPEEEPQLTSLKIIPSPPVKPCVTMVEQHSMSFA